MHDTLDNAIVSGSVTDTGIAPQILGGALVTAQVAGPESVDAKDQVAIEAGSLAATNGDFPLFLKAGGYNLVATQTGYLPSCTAVTLSTDSMTGVDFTLTADTTTPGTISSTASIANSSVGQYVTIVFRHEVTCANELSATPISVKTVNIANSATYTVDLPVGNYQVVTSTLNEITQVADVTATTAGSTLLDISF